MALSAVVAANAPAALASAQDADAGAESLAELPANPADPHEEARDGAQPVPLTAPETAAIAEQALGRSRSQQLRRSEPAVTVVDLVEARRSADVSPAIEASP